MKTEKRNYAGLEGISGIEMYRSKRNGKISNWVLGGLVLACITVAGFGFKKFNDYEQNIKFQKSSLAGMPDVEYVVQEGDSLWKVGKKYIKNKDRYDIEYVIDDILRRNPEIKKCKINKDHAINLPDEQDNGAK